MSAWMFLQRFPTPHILEKSGKRQWEKFLHNRRLWRTKSGLSVGPTLKLKRQLAESVVGATERLGLSKEDVMILFNETRWENWSFGGGRFF